PIARMCSAPYLATTARPPFAAFAARRAERRSSLAGVSLSSDIEPPPSRYCYRIFNGCQARRLMTITDWIDSPALWRSPPEKLWEFRDLLRTKEYGGNGSRIHPA